MQRTNTNIISQLLDEFVKEQGLQDGLQRVRIYKTWDLVVGDSFAAHTVSKYYANGILYCTVNSSMLRNQLYFRKDDIMVQMNKMLNGPLLSNIVLR